MDLFDPSTGPSVLVIFSSVFRFAFVFLDWTRLVVLHAPSSRSSRILRSSLIPAHRTTLLGLVVLLFNPLYSLSFGRSSFQPSSHSFWPPLILHAFSSPSSSFLHALWVFRSIKSPPKITDILRNHSDLNFETHKHLHHLSAHSSLAYAIPSLFPSTHSSR